VLEQSSQQVEVPAAELQVLHLRPEVIAEIVARVDQTRFPISVTSPTANAEQSRHSRPNAGARQSLEVPTDGSPVAVASEPVSNGSPPAALHSITNGSAESAPIMTSATYMPGMDDGLVDVIGVEKRNSLGRAGIASGGGRYSSRRPVGLARTQDQDRRDSVGSLHEERVGVSLTDKPMDD